MTRIAGTRALLATAVVVSILAGAPVVADGEACLAGAGSTCAGGEFCKLPFGSCGTTGDAGVCTPVPENCTTLYEPVCGCDGRTYPNECEADTAGAAIAYPGECQRVCGGLAGTPCGSDEFCLLPAGSCNFADAEGVCVSVPQTCPDVVDPVCGCDHQTYGNRCEAVAAGVQVAYPGECIQVCGGIQGLGCDDGEFCKLPEGQCLVFDGTGICLPIPDACPAIYDPVCGCDGQTYDNACVADQADAQIAHHGECVQVCGGVAGTPCDDGEYCMFPEGSCGVADNQGVCRPIPQGCPDVWDPVCGCDGQTYGNRCEAAAAGAQVDHAGECGPQICGGIAGLPCDAGEFCLLDDGSCDVADAQGVCVPQPQACPDVYDPVCGCDGQTYGNRCDALAAGVQVNHAGECVQFCGGIQGLGCDEGEFCKIAPGQCQVFDVGGICQPIPAACPELYDPVCGCDGQTYANACFADQAGAQIDHAGECVQVCGGIAGLPCDDGEYCMFPEGTCDIADNQGVCRPIPLGCPDNWDPVCGCDGQTYGNRCEAAAAGAQVDHAGECGPAVCGGIAGIPCDDGEFCLFDDGSCDIADAQGVCVPRPQACPDVYDPVCGCDGQTYGNRCDALAAGVQVDHPGECVQFCGGIQGLPCDPGEFCRLPDGQCQVIDASGVCVPIPDACPQVYDPVCGCDGETFANRCFAERAGVQVAHEGECVSICGGIAGIPCDAGEFCEFPAGSCEISDPLGTCVPVPQACPDVCHPVCGCDGVTYGNRCLARQAEVSLSHPGECDPGGRLIHKVLFDSHERMHWAPAPAARAYNVYREVHVTPPPADAGECFLSGLDVPGAIIASKPDEGTVWLLLVSGVFDDGEGPLGISSDCTVRVPEVACGPQ